MTTFISVVIIWLHSLALWLPLAMKHFLKIFKRFTSSFLNILKKCFLCTTINVINKLISSTKQWCFSRFKRMKSTLNTCFIFSVIFTTTSLNRLGLTEGKDTDVTMSVCTWHHAWGTLKFTQILLNEEQRSTFPWNESSFQSVESDYSMERFCIITIYS